MDARATSATSKWIETLALWLSIPLFLLVWQFASTSGYVNELLFPPPTRVAAALWAELINGTLMLDLGMSTMRVVMALSAAPPWQSSSACSPGATPSCRTC
jgi:ABC-type nitrate/sulfonate/bicarbonate transport system permease component